MPTATGRRKDGIYPSQDPDREPVTIVANGKLYTTEPMPDGKGYLVFDEDGQLDSEVRRIPRGDEQEA